MLTSALHSAIVRDGTVPLPNHAAGSMFANRNFSTIACTTERIFSITEMFITAGTFESPFPDILFNKFIEISFNLLVSGNDASDSDELSTSTLDPLDVGALTVTLTLEVLGEGCGIRDAWRLTRQTLVLCGGGIATSTGSSSARFPLGFAAGDGLGSLRVRDLRRLFAFQCGLSLLRGLRILT